MKSLDDFYNQKKKGKLYKNSGCKQCKIKANSKYQKDNAHAVRERHWKRTYGLDDSDYQIMLEKQHGVCGICSKSFSILRIDHCHKTGTVRGLLCDKCNLAIGLLADSKENLLKALSYLEQPPEYFLPNDSAPV
jgi:hypothetical protein